MSIETETTDSAEEQLIAQDPSERVVHEELPDSLDGGFFAQRYGGVVDEVVPGVLTARGFHLANVIQVQTAEGAVIIDTTGSTKTAVQARDALLERNRQEVAYVIYTHCHNDHVRGAEPFLSDATREIIGQEQLAFFQQRDMVCLGNFVYGVLKSHQLGSPIEAGGTYYGTKDPFIPPTLTFRNTFELEVGGLRMRLEHTEGETRDHLMVWIPELSVLCSGDLFYATFPNLSSPGVGPRPITGWIRSLNRFLEIGPEHLVPSHGPAISGRQRVAEVLTNYRDAIQYVWDESLGLMDQGIPVDKAARMVKLPEHLARQQYLEELYGTVAWGVRAVYANLTGWYDGDPASLNRLPSEEVDRELLGLAGADAILDRAQAAHDRGNRQLALELVSIVLSQDERQRRANEIKAAACRALIQESSSANEKNFYLSGALIAEHRLKTET